jgi:hypothetical protein
MVPHQCSGCTKLQPSSMGPSVRDRRECGERKETLWLDDDGGDDDDDDVDDDDYGGDDG